jgi:streptogramin lyase
LLLLMTRTKPGRALLAFLVTVVVVLSVAPAAGAAGDTESLPVGFELEAITVGPSDEGFVALVHSLQVGVEIAEGTHVFEISPAGEATEFPTIFPLGTEAGAAGIAAGPEGSVWIPVEHGLIRADSDGIEDEVELGGGEIERLSTDHKGGVWVIAGQQAVHVTAAGGTHALNLAPLRLAGTPYAGLASLVDDGRGDLWIAVARGREGRARELVERTPSGRLRQFRVPKHLSGTPEQSASGTADRCWSREICSSSSSRTATAPKRSGGRTGSAG